MFSTERLRLRAFRFSDLDGHLDLYNDLEVAKWIAFTEEYIVPATEDVLKEAITKSAKDSLMYCVVEELESEHFVGFIAFSRMGKRSRDAYLGPIALAQQFWNKGYGREVIKFFVNYAFRSLNAHRVTLSVYEGNEKAMVLYKSMLVLGRLPRLSCTDYIHSGFVEETRTRKATWIEGGWKDLVQMGILEEEWRGAFEFAPLKSLIIMGGG